MSTDLLPTGKYEAVAKGCASLGRAKNGNAQVAMVFTITSGDHEGRDCVWFGSFSDNAFEITTKALDACGFMGDDLGTLEDQDLDQPVEIEVEHNDYNDKVTARVKWVNTLGAGAFLKDKMDAKDKRTFGAQFKGMMKGRASARSAPPQRREPKHEERTGHDQQGPPHPSQTDDIPY